MHRILELTEEQRKEVAAIDQDLTACRNAMSKHDRGSRRELMDELQAQTEDLSDLPKAIAAGEAWGRARAAEPQLEAEANQIQATLNGIREKVRDRVREFIKPIAAKASTLATRAAAQFEAEEKAEADAAGFPYVASGKVVGLRQSAKELERLSVDPGGSIPYDNLKNWLQDLRIS